MPQTLSLHQIQSLSKTVNQKEARGRTSYEICKSKFTLFIIIKSANQTTSPRHQFCHNFHYIENINLISSLSPRDDIHSINNTFYTTFAEKEMKANKNGTVSRSISSFL